MRLLLLNVPHPSIGSRIPHEHLPPLGLLAVGGPLIDAGHEVKLLDAEFGPLSTQTIVAQVAAFAPQAVLCGHSGSTSGHPVIAEITRAIRAVLPETRIVYGGVVISLARALSFNGLNNAFHLAAINGGRHVSPCFAGDTVYAWSEVLEKAELPGRKDVGALRIRLVAVKNTDCAAFPLKKADGQYEDSVLLELDAWVLLPR